MRWYGFEPGTKGTRYFEVHSERDHEHAERSRRVLEQAPADDADRIVAAAEAALRGNWTLLDGVERFAQARGVNERQETPGSSSSTSGRGCPGTRFTRR